MSKQDNIPGYVKAENPYYVGAWVYWSEEPEKTQRWYENLNAQKRRNVRKVMAKHKIGLDNRVFGILIDEDMFNDIIEAVS